MLYGGCISSVAPGSIAEEAGILPGDAIISINDHPLTDIIDYRFYAAEEEIDVLVQRGGEQAVISVEKDYDDQLGIEFKEELFDGIRTCANRCIFCFVHQLPKGMRRTLYLKDDDYRLSFLHGNFVTLTNLEDVDIQRIIEQRLSPLYISVHTTEHELREMMLGCHNSPDVMGQIRILAENRITLHTQIVVCPGINDGEHLARTVNDLASLHPGVSSIGIVPVGLTKHRSAKLHLNTVNSSFAKDIIGKVRKWQHEFRKQLGRRLVWASDELYLAADIRVPASAVYEGYPQLENGIGIVRRFIDDARRIRRKLPKSIPHPLKATVVTSTLAAPLVEDFTKYLNMVDNLKVSVAEIKNRFFGESVTVAGLLTGKDIIDQLGKQTNLGEVIIIPTIMLRDRTFLDDVSIDDLSKSLNSAVRIVDPYASALVRELT